MPTPMRVASSVAATALTLAACSSGPETVNLPPGALAAGTAEVSIGGTPLGTTKSVSCSPAGSLTTIVTGDGSAGTTSTIDASNGLVARSVQIRNLGGFTGSYWQDLGEAPTVQMNDRTFTIAGTAVGFATDAPSFRTPGTYAIKVSC